MARALSIGGARSMEWRPGVILTVGVRVAVPVMSAGAAAAFRKLCAEMPRNTLASIRRAKALLVREICIVANVSCGIRRYLWPRPLRKPMARRNNVTALHPAPPVMSHADFRYRRSVVLRRMEGEPRQ